MSDKNSLKQFSFVAFGRTISTILQSLFFIIFAILLEPQVYGEIAYILSIAGTVSILSRFGMPHSVTIYQAKQDHSQSEIINVLVIITSGSSSLILLFFEPFAAMICFSLSLFTMTQHNLLGFQKYKKFFRVSLIRGISILLIPLFLYFLFDINGMLFGIFASYLLASVDFIKIIKKNLRPKLSSVNLRFLLQNFSVDASNNLFRWVDKLVIVPIMGFELVGIYHFNTQILFMLFVLPLSLHSFLLSEESRKKNQNKVTILVILLSVILLSLVIIISPSIIPLIFPKFIEGIESLQILVVSLIPFTISSILSAKLQSQESKFLVLGATVRIVSLLVLLYLLGNSYGLMGLSYAFLLSNVLGTIIFYIIFT